MSHLKRKTANGGRSVKTSLSGLRVLVLEDEYYLADDIRRSLEAAGATVLGPAASLSGGLKLIDGNDRLPDCAVLDVNLRGTPAYELAELLIARGIPFVFATGYDEARLPPAFRDVPKLVKPYELSALLAALEGLAVPPGSTGGPGSWAGVRAGFMR